MKIEDISIEQLLPLFMRRDASCRAFAEVDSELLQLFAREIAKLSTFDALDKLNTAELDELADELSVLWYDRNFTDEQKRALLANSDKVYMTLGTRYAVQTVIQDIFGEASVEEFFEYGGQPHYFRVRVERVGLLSEEMVAKFTRLLEQVKRKSQWLEKIYSETIAKLPLNVGMRVGVFCNTEPRIDTWQDNNDTTARLGVTSREAMEEHYNKES